MNKLFRLATIFFFCVSPVLAQTKNPVYFAPDPGTARVERLGSQLCLSNAVLRQCWKADKAGLQGGNFSNILSKQTLVGPSSLFTFVLSDGRVLDSSALRVISVSSEALSVAPDASRLSDRLPGKVVRVDLEDKARNVHVQWKGILRDGSNYVRQEIQIRAGQDEVPISEVRLLDWTLPDARVIGTSKGSPIVAGTLFLGFEHPLSSCSVALGRAQCRLERELPLESGHSVTYGSVIGVTAAGQLRRGFLYYIERERAHPYRPFLHYNSWYDLGYFDQYNETQAVDVVRAFGRELVQKRGVHLSSFLFDDGWDDHTDLWKFNSAFPDGFTKVREATEKFDAHPGIWMSPWGGYGKPKEERLTAARSSGYEIFDNGLALSGPKYYKLFRDTCFQMMADYGVNQFKFDGTGNANRVFPGSEFDSDFDAAITLISELRTKKPDVFINLTTGTFPSPFWLRYADSIWRGGDDHSFLGVGSKREQWITYRDAETYEHVVMAGPLFPLNSLMLHGLIFAKYAKDLNSDPGSDFENEIRDYFGTGTQLQEMYITPSLLSSADWDDLAEAANWSRANADVLVDTHWIGGDPAKLEVYGWASWSPRKGIVVLRNPSEKPQTISIDVAKAFELPADSAAQAYRARSPWKGDAERGSITLRAGQMRAFDLKPFQVLVLEAAPANSERRPKNPAVR